MSSVNFSNVLNNIQESAETFTNSFRSFYNRAPISVINTVKTCWQNTSFDAAKDAVLDKWETAKVRVLEHSAVAAAITTVAVAGAFFFAPITTVAVGILTFFASDDISEKLEPAIEKIKGWIDWNERSLLTKGAILAAGTLAAIAITAINPAIVIGGTIAAVAAYRLGHCDDDYLSQECAKLPELLKDFAINVKERGQELVTSLRNRS